LGNKYEHKNRTQRGGAGVGGFDVGSRWRVVMQHVIERNTAVSAVSTLATDFLSVSAASSAIACGTRMVAAESVSVNPNSLFQGGFCAESGGFFRPRINVHDLCPIPREGRSGEDRGPPFHRNPTVSRRLARSLLAAAVLAAVPALSFAADRITGHTFATRSEVIAPHAMAATSQRWPPRSRWT
jgi:hypothetical protein